MIHLAEEADREYEVEESAQHQAEVARVLAPLLEEGEASLCQRLLPGTRLNEQGRVQLFRYQDESKGFKRGVKIVEELGGVALDPAVKKSVAVDYEKK